MKKKEKTLKGLVSEYTLEQIDAEVNKKVKSVLNKIDFEAEIKKIYKEAMNTKVFRKTLLSIFENFIIDLEEADMNDYYFNINLEDLKNEIAKEGLKQANISEIMKTKAAQSKIKKSIIAIISDMDWDEVLGDQIYDVIKKKKIRIED